MTGVAWYINDMKRKHEHAVRLQVTNGKRNKVYSIHTVIMAIKRKEKHFYI